MICDDFFFFCYRKFRYCSRIYVRNWFILLNEQNPLLDFEGTRFVNERSLFWKERKNPPTYRPIGEMEGRVREAIIKIDYVIKHKKYICSVGRKISSNL
jgi:hypothetical protein